MEVYRLEPSSRRALWRVCGQVIVSPFPQTAAQLATWLGLRDDVIKIDSLQAKTSALLRGRGVGINF